MWKRLKHPNIVSLYGITIAPPPPQLISDWVLGGNLVEYIKGHPEADRLGLVGALPASSGCRAYRLQGIWHCKWPRIPSL